MRNRVLTATDTTGHRDLALDQGGGGGLDIRLPLLSKGEAEKALKSIGQTAVTTASFIPGVGDAIDVYDFMAALYRGEYGEAGFVLAAAALPGSARAARNVGGEVVERIARNLDETPIMTGDQRALKEIVDEVTQQGRIPLSVDEANIVIQWGQEVNYPGFRASAADVASTNNHWIGGPHIHIPGAGRRHISIAPGVTPIFD